MPARLPPVGQPLRLGPPEPAPTPPAGHVLQLTQSGTAALGLALLLARLRRPLPAGEHAEVLVPGYACPDLLAAAHWAGLRPVLVDLRPDDTRLCLQDLQARCSPNAVAIVAVNFLGIAEDLPALRAVADAAGLLLVEDNAQWMPEPFGSAHLHGDAVVLSFGRGKPVPLVGGGALLVRDALAPQLPALQPAAVSRGGALRTRAALHAYDLLLHPQVYGLLSRLPLGLGSTRYHPLHDVHALDALRAGQLAANLRWQAARTRAIEAAIHAQVLPAAPAGTLDLPALAGERAGRLLRYPLLLPDRATRDRVLAQLDAAGLGATAMYRQVLPEVADVPEGVDCPALPNAHAFADRLLTLPTHAGVNARHVTRMAAAFTAASAR